MKRHSRYRGLRWFVECKWPEYAWYVAIAAFDNERVAQGYADDCARSKLPSVGWAYRVIERTSEDM
jgi:hypothetical protein